MSVVRSGAVARGVARLGATAIAATLLVAAPVIDRSSAEPHPVSATVRSMPLKGVNREALAKAPEVPGPAHRHASEDAPAQERPGLRAQSLTAEPEPDAEPVVVTGQEKTDRFSLVGVTWKGEHEDVTAWVRVRQAGEWSQWYQLPAADDHAPDPDSPEADNARGGTDPLLVDDADGVQVRVDAVGGAPSDLKVDLVDPGESNADASIGSAPLGAADAAPSRPSVYSRGQWGADESLRKSSPSYGTIKAGFVHHTVNANDYSQSQVPGIIRSIYAFHVKSRGWSDIGYNFLVDRFGRVWEGRYGGVDRPVIGAHTGGYNSGSFGMSAIGTYSSATPSTSMMNAYNRVFAWKLGLHGVDPTASTSINGTSFRTVSGHRDSKSTECPGDALYAKLPSIRTTAKSLQGAMLYGTRANRTTWDYGAGGTTISAKVPLNQSYRLQISSPCAGVLRTLSGTASPSKPIAATWDGKNASGRMVPPGSYTATLTSGTSSSQAYPQRISLTVRATSGAPPSYCPPRLGGKSRYDVAVAASKSASSSSKTIVIASGLDTTMGDALVAGPLARSKGGVLLLTQPGGLPSSVSAEIKRRQATTAYVVGGPASVTSNVVSQLRNLGVTSIVRYGGQDRYEVAANVAKAVSSTAPDAVVVSGSDAAFADGLMLSGPAGRLKRPILLVKKDSIPQATAGALGDLRVQRTIVGGGPGSVSDSVLRKLPSAKRIGGANRYEVSVNAANWARSVMDVSDVLISSGRQQALADTLSGGQLGRVTLYVHEGGVPSQVASWLDRSPNLKRVTVMGGPASVPDVVAGRAQRAVIS